MEVVHTETGTKKDVVIRIVSDKDFKVITKQRYFFNWQTERQHSLYKLMLAGQNEILGLMSLKHFEEEQRFEISLLAVSKENRGKNKPYEGIVGNLIAFACKEAVKAYAANGCVSLIPKTELKAHYIKEYGMLDAGIQVFLEGRPLFKILQKYRV